MESLARQHRALLMALGWWYLRRRMRRRAERALAGVVSGEALGLRSTPKSGRSWWKWLLALTIFGGIAWFAWQRLSGGGEDDWGTWEPTVPEPPAADAPSPVDSGPVAPEPAVPAGV
jgi:hypothetical protein